MPSPSANPVQVEWFQNEFTGGVWAESDSLDIGLQVSAVPEPGSYGMLALGLLAVAAALRRRV
ncbi:MAG: PEP-CTERM sorting domain-containing protein [Burkholderiales bacterium]|nr:PEP-CTERM sorting domain-containing protein [Burkholderiales bacterium]